MQLEDLDVNVTGWEGADSTAVGKNRVARVILVNMIMNIGNLIPELVVALLHHVPLSCEVSCRPNTSCWH